MTQPPSGVSTGGKLINLLQLQGEIGTAGVDVSQGLGMTDDVQIIYTYLDAVPADFSPADVPVVQTSIANHVAMREKTDEEYAAEFQNPATTDARKVEINSIINGLTPRELVPM